MAAIAFEALGGLPDTQRLVARAFAAYQRRVADLPPELVDAMERAVVLDAIDTGWREHLADMDELREGVFLRAQGQKDPLVEFKNSGYELFATLMDGIRQAALRNLYRMADRLTAPPAPPAPRPPAPRYRGKRRKSYYSHPARG